MSKRMRSNCQTGLVVLTSLALLMPAHFVYAADPLPSAPQAISQLLSALNRAVCFSQWEQALDLTGALIASSEVTPSYRQQLLEFRTELQQLQATQQVLPDNASCHQVYPRTLAIASETSDAPATLTWESAIASVLQTRAPVIQLDDRSDAEINPVIPPSLLENRPDLLSDAIPIETADGFNVVAGQVGQGHQAFSFLAGLGDQVTLDLDVTRTLPGTLYTNDDSQLFLFDGSGRLVAQNDDADGRQSKIDQFMIPQTDVYFVVVTSHNNDPELTPEQTLSAWPDNGGAQFEYTLTLTGVTPSVALLRVE